MRRYFLLTLVLVCFALSACGGDGLASQTQTVDGLTITYQHPPKATLLKSYDLHVVLNDAQQRPVENADVVLEMDMPTMPMGKNQPVAEAEGNGRYRITTAFNMDGNWKLTVHATSGSKDYQATFDQQVVAQP